MSTIRITIQTDNEAAFGCEGNELKKGKEVARILRELANQFACATPTDPRDADGNHVGTVEIIE